MKKVIIVHGYTGNPQKNWFPWLKEQLQRHGYSVEVPQMPDPNEPVLLNWLNKLKDVVGEADENTYFVGHSLGCPTILRYLEQLHIDKKVGGAVLVAGFAEPISLSELDGFTEGEWNDETIINNIGDIVLINSDNDPYVPLSFGKNMKERFKTKLIVMKNAGHINEKSGHSKLPESLGAIMEIIGS